MRRTLHSKNAYFSPLTIKSLGNELEVIPTLHINKSRDESHLREHEQQQRSGLLSV